MSDYKLEVMSTSDWVRVKLIGGKFWAPTNGVTIKVEASGPPDLEVRLTEQSLKMFRDDEELSEHIKAVLYVKRDGENKIEGLLKKGMKGTATLTIGGVEVANIEQDSDRKVFSFNP